LLLVLLSAEGDCHDAFTSNERLQACHTTALQTNVPHFHSSLKPGHFESGIANGPQPSLLSSTNSHQAACRLCQDR